MKILQSEKSKIEYIARINRVVDHIKNNIDSDLSLEKLSSIAAFSKYYFHRIFKSVSGENINAFIVRIRLEKSAFLLIYRPKESITNIAYDSGFSSPSAYSRAFKSFYNLTPKQWRREKSNICQEKSNPSQLINNLSQVHSSCKTYIDSRTHLPIWRINMKNNQSLQIEVREMPEINIAYIRHRGGYDPHDKKLFQQLFSKLLNWAIPRNLFQPPQTKAMTVYSGGHPETTEPENLTVDVCISIEKHTKVEGEVGKRIIQAGQYAVICLTDATLDECDQAWHEMFDHWLPQSGFQPGDGGYYCNHLNDPEQHPQKLHNVEMYLPVKPL